jgi:hypothetical protein
MTRDHNHNLVRTGTSRASDDAVEDADFVGVNERPGTAAHQARSQGGRFPRDKQATARPPFRDDPTFWSSVRKATRALGLFLLAIVMLVIGLSLMFASTNDSNHTQNATGPSAAPSALVNAGAKVAPPAASSAHTNSAEPSAPATKGAAQLINGCYHLESCTYWEVADTSVLRRGPNWRMVQATLQVGNVANPVGSAVDEDHVVWQEYRPNTYIALCSTTAPTLAWPSGYGYAAEEFDFGGAGVPGVQQDHANIYQAFCHGFYANELAERASAMGYAALPDGGRGQYRVTSLDDLIPGP